MLQRYVRYSFGRAYLCTSENPPDFQKIQEQHELTSRINSILRRQKDGNWCTKGICRREAFTSEQPMSFGSNYSCSCEGSVCLFAFGVFNFGVPYIVASLVVHRSNTLFVVYYHYYYQTRSYFLSSRHTTVLFILY